MYQSEFPVEQPVPVFDPTLLVGLILVVLLIAGLAFAAGRLLGRRDRRGVDTNVPKIIHDAIKARCVAASSAPSGELLQKTQELIEEMEARIGPLLRFGGPCSKALASLRKALEDKAPPEEKPHKPDAGGHGHGSHKPEPKGHGEAEAHPEGHPGHGTGCKCEACLVIAIGHAAPGLSIVGPRVGAQTVVITPPPPPAPPADKPADHKPHDHKPEEPKLLSHKDYSRQVRMAVIDVSDFWSRGDCLKELQACQAALNATQPFRGEGGNDGEGRRSGERAD